MLGEHQIPRPVSLAPGAVNSGVMLLKSVQWIFTEADIKAAPGDAPKDINPIAFVRDARHSSRVLVAGGGFEPPIPLCGIMSFDGQIALDRARSWQKNQLRLFGLSVEARVFELACSRDAAR